VRVYALSPDAIGELPGSNVPPALSISQPGIAPRLSIVVLPFANLSNDPEQQYFADGITEDVTTDLSRLEHMLVISRNTAFTYRNNPIDTKQIGRELGVRYMPEGSVRRSGCHVRVNAIRGRAAYLKPLSRENYAERISMYEQALTLAPQSAEAHSLLALVLAARVLDGMSASAAADIARAEELASQALAASPRSAVAHFAKGHLLRAQQRYADAIPNMRRCSRPIATRWAHYTILASASSTPGR